MEHGLRRSEQYINNNNIPFAAITAFNPVDFEAWLWGFMFIQRQGHW